MIWRRWSSGPQRWKRYVSLPDMLAKRCEFKTNRRFIIPPGLGLDPDIERKSRRNALTTGVAGAFPFASYELSDSGGIFLGLNLYNRSPC